MKLTMKLGSLAVVGLFSVSTLAQVAVRPRPETGRPGEAVRVEPTPATRGQGLEGQFQQSQRPATAARTQQPAAESCSLDGFASDLAKDTKVPFPVAKAAVVEGLITMGTCKGGVVNFNTNARQNLLEMAEYALNNGAAKLSGAARDQVLAKGLEIAKNNDGQIQTTAAAELAVVASLRSNCALIK